MNKRGFGIIPIAFLCLVTGCDRAKERKDFVQTYPVTQPISIDTVISKEFVAQITSLKKIEIRAQEKGFLEKIYIDEGQYVRAGQPLFRIMPQVYQAELAKANAEFQQALIELENVSTLVQNNVVAKNQQSMAQAKVNAAKAEKKLAEIHLSFTDIKAPFSGFINRLPLKLGSLINEGNLLTTLSDNSRIYGYFNVSEQEYLHYQNHSEDRASNKVSLIMANGDKFPNQGKIETIDGEFDAETGNIAFRANFVNSGNLLRHGSTGKIEMMVPLKKAIIIPQKATFEIQDQKYVFVIDRTGHVKSKSIHVAHELQDLYVVGSGLSTSDVILLEGVQKVKDNQRISAKMMDPKKAIASLQLKAE
ncbi:efflux RND transporter periplasmic adaptor subunit [Chryseobacterium sp. ON_d1]|uniref:efflux RND transporter periplasmic adaptor subunit n=1 Tax=Chryseobacterium sp. ON_d1 TaxID=2583211 RepID=UPI00115732CF|nr:efflux RND transporter periplasmic adaptor subunit [Chryseobacterium sp. ON_d1]GEJ45937.1 hemolysin D [Chryseobacterium sp. ON_d1]